MSPSPWMDAIGPGDGCIDIGANVGSIAIQLAKKVGPTGCVLAVEPDPETAKECRKRLREYPWVEVLERVVTNEAQWTKLHLDTTNTRHSIVKANVLEDAESAAFICGTTLDMLAAKVPNLKAIKIDAQGAEAKILEGGTETLKRKGLVWKVEFWPEGLRNAGSSVYRLADVFAAHGYVPHDDYWALQLARMQHMTGHKATDVVIVQ